MKKFADITGWGKCLPPKALTNNDLATFMETNDEWITSRTGISQRYVSHVGTSDLATVAAQRALACAGVDANDIDLIIVSTCSPQSIIPSTATFVQENIGAKKAAAFDLNAACSGFLYGLNMATSMINAGAIEKALIIGAEHLTWYINWDERDSAVIFGDGSGAVVIEASDTESGVLGYCQSNDPTGKHCIQVHDFGTNTEKGNIIPALQFEGRDVFKKAVPGMVRMSHNALEKSGHQLSDIELVIPHQANIRIIEAVVNKLGASMDDTFVNIANYGNTSAATIPIAINDAIEQGRIQPGQLILSPAFGAGLTSAASVIRWGSRVTPLGETDAELPPCDKSALELIGRA